MNAWRETSSFSLIRIVILTIAISTTQLLSGQSLDSLKNALSTSPDSVKMKLYSDLCWGYRRADPDLAIEYGKSSLDLARELGNLTVEAQALNDLGIIKFDQGSYDAALSFYNKSLSIRTSLKDVKGLAGLHNKKGIVFQSKGDYEKALTEQMTALRLYEELGWKHGISYSQNNIAIIHGNQKNFEEALKYHQLSLALKKEAKDNYGTAGSLVNIGNIYHQRKQISAAIENYESALVLLRSIEAPSYTAATLNNLGSAYIDNRDYERGLVYLEEALAIREKLQEKKGIASTLNNLGSAYLGLSEMPKANSYFLRAVSLSKELDVKPELQQAYLNMANWNESEGDYKLALEFQKLAEVVKDSLFNSERSEKIAEMEVLYQTEKKEQEIALNQLTIEKQKQRNFFQLVGFIVGLLALVVFANLWFRNHRLRSKARVEMQRKLWQKEETKSVIYARDIERRRIARDLHDGIGQLVASAKMGFSALEPVLENASEEDQSLWGDSIGVIDQLALEVREISHSMMPGALARMGLKAALRDLCRSMNKDPNCQVILEEQWLSGKLSDQIEIAAFRLSQEMLSNSLKHSAASEIVFSVQESTENLLLKVQDNGRGFELNEIENSSGIGWKNIRLRTSILDGNLKIDSHKGSGSAVTITIPIQ